MTSETTLDNRREGERHLFPVSRLRRLDNWLRPLVHNPKTLVGPSLQPGMTALDVGCGGGFLTMAMARFVGETGRVIAAELQPEMLDAVAARATREGLAGRVQLHRCTEDRIGVTDELDLGVAFFMLHEVPDQRGFLEELWDRLRPGGRLLVAEPMFHVPKRNFEQEVALAEAVGFVVEARPNVLGGRAAMLGKR